MAADNIILFLEVSKPTSPRVHSSRRKVAGSSSNVELPLETIPALEIIPLHAMPKLIHRALHSHANTRTHGSAKTSVSTLEILLEHTRSLETSTA
jgi:hypothetical protein